jgi:hypothetical protein
LLELTSVVGGGLIVQRLDAVASAHTRLAFVNPLFVLRRDALQLIMIAHDIASQPAEVISGLSRTFFVAFAP